MFLISKRVKLIEKKKFVAAVFYLDYKAFIIYIVALKISFDLDAKVHSLKKAQIAYPKVDKTLTKISNKYINFANVFSQKLVRKFLKHMSINNYIT